MKRLFKLFLFLGLVAVAVAVVTNASRRRGAPPKAIRPTPWQPPTVETAPEPEPAPSTTTVEEEAPQAVDASAFEIAGTNGAVGVSELVAPGVEAVQDVNAPADEEPALTPEEVDAVASLPGGAEEGGEETLAAVADDEGMAQVSAPAPEDIAVGAEGDVLVSEFAAPGADVELLEAALEEAAVEEAAAVIPAEPDVVSEEAPEPVGEIAEAGASPAAEAEAAPDFDAMLAEAEESGLAEPPEPTAPAGEAAKEPDFLTEYFEKLAATPDVAEVVEESPPLATPASPASQADDDLFASVEEALDDLEPAPIVAPPRRSAESYLDEGNVYFNVGQYGLAIERYGQAIILDDSLTAAYYNRANAHTRSGDFEKALGDYDRALELQPADADALNNRGMLHLYRSNYSAALGDFNRALEIDPSDTTVMVNRGLAQLHGGNSAGALVDFREAAKMDEGDAAAQYGAAQAAASMGNRDEALRHVSRALEIDPGYAREAAADPRLAVLSGDEEFMKLLRQSGTRTS